MPDISMCQNKDCRLSQRCYRFTAKPSDPWQTYFVDIEPVTEDDIDGACEHFWDNSGRDTKCTTK